MGLIHDAVRANDLAAIDGYLNNGVSIEQKDAGYTTLMVAVGEGTEETIRFLIAQGANVNVECGGRTPLVNAASFGYGETCKILIEAGARIDERDGQGRTALMHAAYNNLDDLVGMLIDYGADVKVRNNKDQTALDIAAGSTAELAADSLMRRGADLSDTLLFRTKKTKQLRWLMYDVPLLAAALRRDAARVSAMLADPAMNRMATNRQGEDLLMIASETGCVELMDILLSAGFDVNAESRSGWTALDLAISTGKSDVVPHLLELGANLLPRRPGRASPLMFASHDRRLDILRTLLDFAATHGIELDIDDGLRVAERDGDIGAAQMLRQYASSHLS